MAASIGFKDGMRAAGRFLLEPIMAVEVETPVEKMGDVMATVSRRGVMQGWTTSPAAVARPCAPRCAGRDVRLRPGCVRSRKGAPPTRWNSNTMPRHEERSEAVINAKVDGLGQALIRSRQTASGRNLTMAKGKFQRTKPHVMGDDWTRGSCKTTLTAAMTLCWRRSLEGR